MPKKQGVADLPEGLADKIHFWGIIETPRDLVKFFCGSYVILADRIRITHFLLDTASTGKSAFLQEGKIYYEKIELVGYMAAFFPYVPYKHRGEK